VGRLVDRFGPRTHDDGGGDAPRRRLSGLRRRVGLVSLAVGFAALRFLGRGSMTLSCSNMVSQWFSRRRGFALSLAAARLCRGRGVPADAGGVTGSEHVE
jgi:hypothetical protein